MRSCFFRVPAASMSSERASRASSATFMCFRSAMFDGEGVVVGAAAGMCRFSAGRGTARGDRAAGRSFEGTVGGGLGSYAVV